MNIPKLPTVHLFAGAGGSCLAFELLGFPSVGVVENDPYCQAVLEARGEKLLESDIRNYHPIPNTIGIVCGGFPCQDVSIAGKRAGLAGSRSGLWWEMLRVWKESKAPYLFAENVTGLLSQGGGADYAALLGSLAEMGADAVWCVLPAFSVGAPYKRKRWFLLASSQSARCGSYIVPLGMEKEQSIIGGGSTRCGSKSTAEESQPEMGGSTYGLANGLDWPASRGHWPSGKGEPQKAWEAPRVIDKRSKSDTKALKALGNGWVPQQAALAFTYLWKALHNT